MNRTSLVKRALSARILCIPLCFAAAAFTHGQTFTNPPPGTFSVLHYFTNYSDGAQPVGGLILVSNALYGSTYQGGTNGNGTLFALNTDGTGYQILYQFSPMTAVQGSGTHPTNSDGANPQGALLLAGSTLFGTSSQGGPNQNGTLFSIGLDGTHFTTLFSYPGATLSWQALSSPTGDLVPVGSSFYGATSLGYNSLGVIYSIGNDGTSYNPLFTFTDRTHNGDGPTGGPTLLNNVLYGMTFGGGTVGNGNVFSVGTNGTNFAQLYSFPTATWDSGNFVSTNFSGYNPVGQMKASGGKLFGMTEYGGLFGNGTIFSINPDGSALTVLHHFTALGSGSTNLDGANPLTDLIAAGNTIYGSTVAGGTFGNGVIFSMNRDGSSFTVLHNLSSPSDGYSPNKLLLSGNILYGTTRGGGMYGFGAIFSLRITPPAVVISGSAGSNGLSMNFSGAPNSVTLIQMTTNLASAAAWQTVATNTADATGQAQFTNSILRQSPGHYYRAVTPNN